MNPNGRPLTNEELLSRVAELEDQLGAKTGEVERMREGRSADALTIEDLRRHLAAASNMLEVIGAICNLDISTEGATALHASLREGDRAVADRVLALRFKFAVASRISSDARTVLGNKKREFMEYLEAARKLALAKTTAEVRTLDRSLPADVRVNLGPFVAMRSALLEHIGLVEEMKSRRHDQPVSDPASSRLAELLDAIQRIYALKSLEELDDFVCAIRGSKLHSNVELVVLLRAASLHAEKRAEREGGELCSLVDGLANAETEEEVLRCWDNASEFARRCHGLQRFRERLRDLLRAGPSRLPGLQEHQLAALQALRFTRDRISEIFDATTVGDLVKIASDGRLIPPLAARALTLKLALVKITSDLGSRQGEKS